MTFIEQPKVLESEYFTTFGCFLLPLTLLLDTVMTKELAHYVFAEETLFHFPAQVQPSVSIAEPNLTTPKHHAWLFGEKPTGEKRELMVKLLQACQLKANDVEFYFETLDTSALANQNKHLKTLIVFGPNAGIWTNEWPIQAIHVHKNTTVLFAFSLDELVKNKQHEKRQFWAWLQKMYGLS